VLSFSLFLRYFLPFSFIIYLSLSPLFYLPFFPFLFPLLTTSTLKKEGSSSSKTSIIRALNVDCNKHTILLSSFFLDLLKINSVQTATRKKASHSQRFLLICTAMSVIIIGIVHSRGVNCTDIIALLMKLWPSGIQ
jgi:hypothetical protein